MFDAMVYTGFVEHMIPGRLWFAGGGKPIRERLIVISEHLTDHKRRSGDQVIQKALGCLGQPSLAQLQIDPASGTVNGHEQIAPGEK